MLQTILSVSDDLFAETEGAGKSFRCHCHALSGLQ